MDEKLTVLDSLNRALHNAFKQDVRVILLGEDVNDPYGGAFKVTRGLSSTYPDRVFTTPISEAAITGVAAGMALRGLKPVVEIMFGDFITLIADQLVNHIAKFRWMYNDQVRVPLVIRTPMGGRRGYGPTHSQTLEKLFLGIPGLYMLAASAYGNPGKVLSDAILDEDDPVLFIENKLLYPLPINTQKSLPEFYIEIHKGRMNLAPTYILTIRDAPPPVLTLATYGYMAEQAREAALRLAYESELFIEMVVLTLLAPFDIQPILTSVERTGRLLTVEEGTLTLGWGAEVIARTAETLGQDLKLARRLAASEHPIPASPVLEGFTLPNVENIIKAVQAMTV